MKASEFEQLYNRPVLVQFVSPLLFVIDSGRTDDERRIVPKPVMPPQEQAEQGMMPPVMPAVVGTMAPLEGAEEMLVISAENPDGSGGKIVIRADAILAVRLVTEPKPMVQRAGSSRVVLPG